MVKLNAIAMIASFAEGEAAVAGGFRFSPMTLMMVALIIMMGFSVYKQRKRGKEIEKMRSAIGVGDEIVTIGGFCGTIVENLDSEFVLESEGTRLKIKKWAVQATVNKEDAPAPVTGGKG